MDHLDLRIGFEAELPGLHGGDHAFGCVAVDGHYPLPTVVLLTRDGQPLAFPRELAVAGTTDGPPAVRQWLENTWAAAGVLPPRQPVLGRATAVPGLWIPCDVVHGGAVQGPVRVQVHWSLVFTDDRGESHPDYATVTLVFGTAEPKHSQPALKGLPRHTGEDATYGDFAAVDFGTTSCTVTYYNSDDVTVLAMDPAQEQELARALADVLDGSLTPSTGSAGTAGAGGPGGTEGPPAGWASEAARLCAAALSPSGGAGPAAGPGTVDRVCERLRRGSPDSELVMAVCHQLELSARDAGGPWAVHGLQSAYERAFMVPPLGKLGLGQVSFPGLTRSHEVTSALAAKDGTLHLSAEGPGAIRNLKRMLRRPALVPLPDLGLGEDVAYPSDDLIALAFVRLVEAAEPALRNPETGEWRRLVELVVTSPTTTPPDTRARLTRLLKEQADIQEVVTDYDEGVSAGLFHLMRDFAGDAGAGVEALRARAHPVPGQERPTWFHTMLIIDIGGGTTDIALLGLTLTDLTDDEEIPQEERGTHGRTYELRPEVLGSTGHPDLGGDYLTLRVFYLLKATLVDALLELAHARSGDRGGTCGDDPGRELLDLLPPEFAPAADGPGSLAAAVVDQLSARKLARTLVRPEIRQVLSQVLPTGWAEGSVQESALFHELWAAAEQAKFDLGTGGGLPWTATTTEVDSWLAQLPQQEADEQRHQRYLHDLVAGHAKGELLRLRPEDFVRIAEPVFREAAAVALDIVQSRFAREDGPRLVLDRVLLSGRSTMMPLAEEVVTLVLAAERRVDGTPLFENLRSVRSEPVYAKQATSLGAAWAHVRSLTVHRRGGSDDIGGSRVGTRVDIYSGDLSPTLACDFEVMTPGNVPVKVLSVGEPYEAMTHGSMVVRTDWGPPDKKLSLMRPLNKEVRMNWGYFRVEREARTQGVGLDPDVWWGRLSAGIKPLVQMQIEIDQHLAPRVNYRLGKRTHLVVDGPCLDLVEEGFAELDVDGLLRGPGLGLCLYGVTRDNKRGRPVTVLEPASVSGPGPGLGDGPEATPATGFAAFPEFFHESQDLDAPGQPLPGLLLHFVAPRPAEDYIVEVIRPDGSRAELGRLSVPSGMTRHGERHTLSLDSRGRIRVHRFLLPDLQAKDIRTMLTYPGAVYSAPLRQDLESLFPDWNPFRGRH